MMQEIVKAKVQLGDWLYIYGGLKNPYSRLERLREKETLHDGTKRHC